MAATLWESPNIEPEHSGTN